MELHVGYEEVMEYPLRWVENKDVPISWHVEKMKLLPGKDTLVVNEWLTYNTLWSTKKFLVLSSMVQKYVSLE
jgi:hypothetical protein